MDTDSPFEQVWVDRIQEIHASLSDEGYSKLTLPDGTAIWPREIILYLRSYSPYKIEIIGVTDEAACYTGTLYLDNDKDYPEDLAQFIPELIEAARNCPGGFGMELESRPSAPAYPIGPHGLAELLEAHFAHTIPAPNPN